MNSHTLRTGIASGTCMSLGLALSVVTGVLPHASGVSASGVHGEGADVPFRSLLDADQTTPVWTPNRPAAQPQPAATTPAAHVSHAAHSGAAHLATVHDASSAASSTTTAAVTTKQPATTHKKKTHHKKKATHRKPGHKTVTTPTLAARTTPADSAVSDAITGLKKYIKTPFSINSSEVSSFGNDVCSAFDSNDTLSQVESEILTELQKLPYTTVEAGAADFVVHTAVKLYCPGYNSRLG